MFAFVCLFVCLFFCLFVRSTTQKRMMSKCSNLVEGMTLRYLRNDVVLGLKGQGHRVNKCIFDACVNAHLTDNSNTAWVRTLWVPSISIVESADGGAGYSARCLCATTVVKLVDDRGWELCPSSRGRTLRYFFWIFNLSDEVAQCALDADIPDYQWWFCLGFWDITHENISIIYSKYMYLPAMLMRVIPKVRGRSLAPTGVAHIGAIPETEKVFMSVGIGRILESVCLSVNLSVA